MKSRLPLLAAAAFMAVGVAQAADPRVSGGPGISLPTFEQVDTRGQGQITPDEAAMAGLVIDWSKADPLYTGRLTKSQYMQAVNNGYVRNAADAAPLRRPPN